MVSTAYISIFQASDLSYVSKCDFSTNSLLDSLLGPTRIEIKDTIVCALACPALRCKVAVFPEKVLLLSDTNELVNQYDSDAELGHYTAACLDERTNQIVTGTENGYVQYYELVKDDAEQTIRLNGTRTQLLSQERTISHICCFKHYLTVVFEFKLTRVYNTTST